MQNESQEASYSIKVNSLKRHAKMFCVVNGFSSHGSSLNGPSIYRAVSYTVKFELKFDRIEYGGGICTATQRCAH